MDIGKKSTIVSLFITLLLFPKAAVTTLTQFTTLIINFFRQILNASWVVIMGPDGTESGTLISDFIALFSHHSLGFVNRLISDVTEMMDRLPFTEAFLFFGVWILISLVTEQIIDSKTQPPINLPDIDPRSRIILSFIKKNKDSILFGAILTFALFLSVSAMIAVPYISQNSQKFKYDSDYLKKSLDTYLIEEAFLNDELKAHAADSLAYERQLGGWLTVSADSLEKICGHPLPQNIRQQWTQHISSIHGLLKQAVTNDLGQIRKIEVFKKEILSRQKKESQMLSENFLITSNSLTNNDEANEYFKRLVWWFSQESDNLKTVLDEAYNKLKYNKSYQGSMFSILRSSIENEAAKLEQSRTLDRLYLMDTENMKLALMQQKNDIESATFRHTSIPMPSVPKAGMSWGVFGQIAQWLLASRSYELAILTGMFGFGLFGASISTLIRYQDSEQSSSIGYRIIIKGLSAAVLLFLSIMGGTALLGIETSKPNAYTLFFLCLIGSVFSDTVWDWAKGKLPGIESKPVTKKPEEDNGLKENHESADENR
ncbi:hypothetical protein [Chlorobium phaeobacteroides]|uniref:hypothetical protein n=1 Tax=Chlorobium phaeobacteroides TaxID=1096 RepID=UPI0012326274|nr:hypothetical protein [Chlorobium phaeobacteroides]